MTRAESAGRLSDAAWGVAGVLLVFGGWEAASRLGHQPLQQAMVGITVELQHV